MIKVSPYNLSWHFSTIYPGTNYNTCRILWQNLISYSHSITGPWLVAEDFNEILSQNDKCGGESINTSRSSDF